MHTYVTVGKEYKTGMYVSALLDNMVLSMTVSQNMVYNIMKVWPYKGKYRQHVHRIRWNLNLYTSIVIHCR